MTEITLHPAGHVLAVVTGRENAADDLANIRRIAELIAQSGHDLVLVDLSARETVSDTTSVWDLAQAFARHCPTVRAVAQVEPGGSSWTNAEAFANRLTALGIPCRLFETRAAAQAWLAAWAEPARAEAS